MTEVTGYICGPRLYEFEGWFFEFHANSGPWPLKKDGEFRQRAGKVFYDMIGRFQALTKAEREGYRVGGGCVEI